jgi:hypothetical protein
MIDESGKIIKFTLKTPGYRHVSESLHKHTLTAEQEADLALLWEEFKATVWQMVSGVENPRSHSQQISHPNH